MLLDITLKAAICVSLAADISIQILAEALPVVLDGESETIYSNLASEPAYICRGALQLDLRYPDRLLIGVKTKHSGVIGHLVLPNLTLPLTELYGNSSAPHTLSDLFLDGVGAEARLVQPTDLYQTEDKARILFVDDNSCAREVDRNSGNVSTVFGEGHCGSGTLGLFNISRLISGMTYYEKRDMWLFSILTKGVYTYEKDNTGVYTGRLLVDAQSTSHSPPDDFRQVYLADDVIWNKVRYGLNIYNLSLVNSTDQLMYDNSSFIRILRSAGGREAADPTAWYSYDSQELQLGKTDADLSLSPDGRTLLILDLPLDRIFLFGTTSGELQAFCSKEKSSNVSLVDGTGETCTFHEIEAGLWLDDSTVLVAERTPSQFRKLQFVRHGLDSTSTASVPPSATPYRQLEEWTWWIVLAISAAFCPALFIFWITVKVVQCRRHGIVFDIFSEEEEDTLDPLAARDINFLYNKAAKRQMYVKRQTKTTTKMKSSKEQRKKSREDKKVKKLKSFGSAAEYITEKFQLLRRKKKKKTGVDGMEEELNPLPKPVKPKAKKTKRSSIDIDVLGSSVSVPFKRTSAGRARPLPSLPISKTI